MFAVVLDLDNVSRLALAFACALSALAAGILAVVTHPRYTPHMILVSFWSVWFCIAMLDLASVRFDFPGIPDRLITANLNGSATVVVAGWALLAGRLIYDARKVVKQVVPNAAIEA